MVSSPELSCLGLQDQAAESFMHTLEQWNCQIAAQGTPGE